MKPSLTRINFRYRGPVESKKLNNMLNSIYNDLNRLYSLYIEAIDHATDLAVKLYDGTTTSPVIVGDSVVESVPGIVEIKRMLTDIERQVK